MSDNPRPGYKQTEIGEIPEEWKVDIAKNIFPKVTDGTHDTPKPSSEGYPLITSKNLKNGSINFDKCYLIKESDYNEVNKRSKVEHCDVLFGMIGTIGNPVFIKKEYKNFAIKNIGLFKTGGDSSLGKWLYYYLSSAIIKRYIDRKLEGTSQKFIPLGFLRQLLILLPPRKERNKIVSILSAVEEAIQNADGIIAKTEELKKGLMQEVLTRGIGHTRFKKTEIGEIPEEWTRKKLSEVGKFINGYAFKPSDWKKSGIPIVRIQNLNDRQAKFNYFDGNIENKYILHDGDLLLSWSASLGVYLWKRGKAALNQHIFKVLPEENVDKLFLFYMLHKTIKTLKRHVHGSTMRHFKKRELDATAIALPPFPEQQKIADILFMVDEKINSEKNTKEKLKELKKGLMQVLLTGEVRVKIGDDA